MSTNLSAFVKQTVEDLNHSMPEGWELDQTIQFEVTVITTETLEGKIDIKILSAGGNTKGEAVQKMNFSITHKAKSDAAEENQYAVISKGITAIFKPLMDLDKILPSTQNDDIKSQ